MNTLDLDFDYTYGDFVIENGELALINSYRSYIKNYIINKLKTQAGDIYASPEAGMPFDSYLGKGLDNTRLKQLEEQLLANLTSEGVLTRSEVEVFSLFRTNTLYIRIVVTKDNLALTAGVTINEKGEISSD